MLGAIFAPESPARRVWDLVVLAVAVAAAVVLPLTVAFEEAEAGLAPVAGWTTTVVFAADLVVKAAGGRRGGTRLWIDVLAALPLGPAAGALGIGSSLAARILRLNPLLKLVSAVRGFRRIDARVNPAVLRLARLVFWILLAMHMMACGWVLVSGNPDGLPLAERYLYAFYWTLTTVATIGYGDITPTGAGQVLYVVVVEALGAAMYGMVIANIASLVANIDVAKVQHRERLERVNAFLNFRGVPAELGRRINDYYNYLWESRRGYEESGVLRELPDALRVSVLLHLNRPIIEKVPLFREAGEDLIRDIVTALQPVVFTPGDVVVRAGEIGADMYFVGKGTVEVVSADQRTVFATLNEGQFFGEIALLASVPRTATVRAATYCDLYRLDKASFDRVIARYPEFARSIKEMADRRRAELEGSSQQR